MEQAINGQKNRLTRQESRRLEDWILSQWDRIEKERPNRAELSKRAGGELSIVVTPGNLSSAVDAIGREYPRPHRDGSGKVAASRRRWLIVCDALTDIIRKCGELIPNDLVQLMNQVREPQE